MSTVTHGPAVTTSAPLPQPIPFNLFTVASEVTVADGGGDLDSRWLNGEYILGYLADLGAGVQPCDPPTAELKDIGSELDVPLFGAVTIYVPETCTAYSIRSWEDFVRRGNAVMNAVLSWHAERQLAGGVYKNDNPYLADLDATDPEGGAVDATPLSPMEALAQLEDAIGRTGRAGVIHATPGTVVAWTSLSLLQVTQGQLRTIGGTPVVKGAGYIDIFPLAGGAAGGDDQEWAWATGPIVYQRSPQVVMNPPLLKEAMDRVTNEVTYRAEADLIVAWDTQLQATVLVDRSL